MTTKNEPERPDLADINAEMARIDGALGAAGHAITDPAARKNLRELAAGEITAEEARANVFRRAAERGAI